jgi:hypothetical protein
MILISIIDCKREKYKNKRTEPQLPFIPSMAPRTTCRAAASYT